MAAPAGLHTAPLVLSYPIIGAQLPSDRNMMGGNFTPSPSPDYSVVSCCRLPCLVRPLSSIPTQDLSSPLPPFGYREASSAATTPRLSSGATMPSCASPQAWIHFFVGSTIVLLLCSSPRSLRAPMWAKALDSRCGDDNPQV